jgi:AAA15 family ATPase/GTPase
MMQKKKKANVPISKVANDILLEIMDAGEISLEELAFKTGYSEYQVMKAWLSIMNDVPYIGFTEDRVFFVLKKHREEAKKDAQRLKQLREEGEEGEVMEVV